MNYRFSSPFTFESPKVAILPENRVVVQKSSAIGMTVEFARFDTLLQQVDATDEVKVFEMSNTPFRKKMISLYVHNRLPNNPYPQKWPVILGVK